MELLNLLIRVLVASLLGVFILFTVIIGGIVVVEIIREYRRGLKNENDGTGI